MPTPSELSSRFITAFNQRDPATIRGLLAPELEYIRPGGGTLRTADTVMAQYERDWASMSAARVEFRQVAENSDGVVAEMTLTATVNGREFAVPGAVAHRWRDGLLVRYRLYLDSPPAEIAAIQPPAQARD